ncbi:hypothetical protein Lalb_Chr18g0046451 [Lupinus albus]|uniref:Uncharacterized protein n=1 Tax=Lupinus albus TaxID=3870 RepID=A0A6A4P0S8_LUPAL|nr:hypothetical protein Lalb_Chr18g0046451 [Lupinus albus]
MRINGRFFWRSVYESRKLFQSTTNFSFRHQIPFSLRSYSSAEVQPQMSMDLLNIMEQRLRVIEHMTTSLNNILNRVMQCHFQFFFLFQHFCKFNFRVNKTQ